MQLLFVFLFKVGLQSMQHFVHRKRR